MRCLALTGVCLLAACASRSTAPAEPRPELPPAADTRPEPDILTAHLEYLNRLRAAELAFEDGRTTDALGSSRTALEIDVRPSACGMFGELPQHAVAKYYEARALASLGELDASATALQAAAAADFSDKSRVASDEMLEPLRSRNDWPDLLAAFRDEDAADESAGHTVTDQDSGMLLLRSRLSNHPKLGERAPDFELERADGKGTIRLSEYHTDRPVVLVFGSWT